MRNALPSILITTISMLLATASVGQEQGMKPSPDESAAFFKSQSTEFGNWLEKNLPKAQYQITSVTTEPRRVAFTLMPKQGASCSDARAAWETVNKQQPDFSGDILRRLAAVSGIEAHEAHLEVQCCTKGHFYRTFAFSEKLPDSQVARSVAPVPLVTPLAMAFDEPLSPKSTDETELSTVIPNARATEVSRKVRAFCEQKYRTLPKARYIWDAELKYTEISDTEFNLEVTYITNVAISDGYFEYHKIYVQTQQSGNNAILQVRFIAKYGSGIIFAPKRSDYKELQSSSYKSELEEYRTVFFKQIINAATK
jgi:hypothetical protein